MDKKFDVSFINEWWVLNDDKLLSDKRNKTLQEVTVTLHCIIDRLSEQNVEILKHVNM